MARFEPARAGLPGVSKGEAGSYIEAKRGDRPWLNSAHRAPDDVQRVFAALDQGGGHAHIRHEGWLSMEKSQLRVLGLQDPAQLDPAKRAAGKDGLIPGDKPHYCAAMSTCIRDRTAFAVAFARGTEHPRVRAVLDAAEPSKQPRPGIVSIPISDVLGPNGHEHCEGYALAGDDPRQAAHERRIWLREKQAGHASSVPAPAVVPIDFRRGTLQYVFGLKPSGEYEIVSMYPASSDRDLDG